MSAEIPATPEKKEVLDDNALKFTLEGLDPAFLDDHNAKSYVLTTDWLETGEDTEKKLAYKKYDDDTIELLLIEKVMIDGDRTAQKTRLTDEEYSQLLDSAILHVEKKRHEFSYVQGTTLFLIKYDEFADSALRVLEVDAATEDERNKFDPAQFPVELTDVTGNLQYYGYRVAGVLHDSHS